MKNDHFNKENPFRVPEGYFDSLQERIMANIEEEYHPAVKGHRTFRINLYQTLVVAAACLVFIFVTAALYLAYSDRQTVTAEVNIDDDAFYQWFYASDKTTFLAESLNANMPESFDADEEDISEEDEAIIYFLERNNINVIAIANSMDNMAFYNQP